MKKPGFFLLALMLTLNAAAQDYLNVLTFNIRYNNPGDGVNTWSNRKDFAASQILFHNVHTAGLQEAFHGQLKDLMERLPGYKYIGVGREDGKEKGEYSAIMYNTGRLELLESSTFWLSEHPEIPGSKGWDAALARIVTWAKFKDIQTGKVFYHFNTHFDHIGKIARRESAKLILQKVKEIAGKTTSIITGDFNAEPSEEPIKVLLDTKDPLHLTDTKALSITPHYGPTGTFTGFDSKEKSDEPIDYIFLKNGGKVLQHATLSQTWGGRFSSDHFPVFARIII